LDNKKKENSMDTPEQEIRQTPEALEEVGEESLQQEQETGQNVQNEENETTGKTVQEITETKERTRVSTTWNRSGFVHGLAAGLGIGCITAFIIMWMAVFFTPRLPSGITYEAMLATFIYPLIYLLALGLIALTVGIVSQYYTANIRPQTQKQ
jgi:hypothetical protein